MSDIVENNKGLEENMNIEIEKPQTDIAGNDISSMLLARLDAMENRFIEMSKPIPKKKREPTEKQRLALEAARVKKMENFAIRKQLKEDKKKELKEKSKIEVEEYKKEVEKKSEPIVNDTVEKDDVVVPVATQPVPIPKVKSRIAPPINEQSVSYDTYVNEPDRKSTQKGMSGRARMSALFGD